MTLIPQNRDRLVTAAATDIIARGSARKRRPTRRSARVLAVALVAAMVPAGVAVSQLKSESAPEAALPVLGADSSGRVPERRAPATVPSRMLNAYGALAIAPSVADRDNKAIRGLAKNAAGFGLDADAARVLTTQKGNRVWLIPGNAYLCIGVQYDTEYVAMGCNTEEEALVHGLNTSDGSTVTGIVPDGVDHLDMRKPDTTTKRRVAVSDNVYSIPADDVRVSYELKGKQERFRIVG